ncbi:GGDEF domain-containing protein [Serratia quinivorans]|uniref:GGDEF domain-containing protein n=1 Tax=Serratia quinivorans TaxID=137545 RepID=UPI002177B063|nr:GGDEF domain-containing protein [Serratia quinivorans]CAI0867007.1 Stalked cell differentiation-controlling protein [Serratia quinivorans]CAI0889655.1 Stalked cell differentiation-controlling protein [Serratia quinivorans]CAI0915531.1 Stalked cell differentiation-controlling protein [Serratia quinivorans]CAI1513070.1 Stalked cell differentiation-controlling protein [Serratia quinivorans]CAI2056623.1 Stalked cell differentiation-controlling protein [Serratia quinivorans]
MKVKYLIYFFTFALMSSFALFISDELLEANTDYRDNQLNLYKITRAKEISEAFQATLLAHRLKHLSLIDPEITPQQWQDADRLAREKIARFRPHIDSAISQQLGIRQKIAALSMLSLMEQLLNNDNLQLSHITDAKANLFNINSAYYISQASKSYYRYSYDNRMVDADSFLFLEAVRLNKRLNMSVTELVDQVIDINTNPLERKVAYLKAVQLTGVLSALSTRLIFMKLTYNDVQTTLLVNEILEHLSTRKISRITTGLYTAMDTHTAYPTESICQYVRNLSELSQRLFQRSFELEVTASQHKIYDSQTAIYGMISLAGLIALFIFLPTLVYCSNISRWLTKTHNNILRLSRGNMNIDRNEVFYGQELMAISDAIKQLKQYQMEKVTLENEKHLLIKELEASSFLDPLTNIYNRRKFFRECESLAASSYPLAFCLIDIDNFKNINDSYGHHVGDLVLVAFGKLLQNSFRSSDIFCRYGGEEFAVILGHCTLENAREVMSKLREHTHQLTLTIANGQNVRFTTSCGIAQVSDIRRLPMAIKQADEALYFSKNNGKDRIGIHTPSGFI